MPRGATLRALGLPRNERCRHGVAVRRSAAVILGEEPRVTLATWQVWRAAARSVHTTSRGAQERNPPREHGQAQTKAAFSRQQAAAAGALGHALGCADHAANY